MSTVIAWPIAFARRAWTATKRLVRGRERTAERAASRRGAPGPPGVLEGELPVHAYVVLEPRRGELEKLLKRLTRTSSSDKHRPVIFTDGMDFPTIAATTIAFEYVPDRATWQQHRPDQPWEDFVRNRLTELDRCHRPTETVVVTAPKSLHFR